MEERTVADMWKTAKRNAEPRDTKAMLQQLQWEKEKELAMSAEERKQQYNLKVQAAMRRLLITGG